MKQALVALLDALDTIAADGFEEVHDTDVREHMSDAIFAGFIEPQDDDPLEVLPEEFGMFTTEGNARVREALSEFLTHAQTRDAADLPTRDERLAAFQDETAESADGSRYDDYFGHTE